MNAVKMKQNWSIKNTNEISLPKASVKMTNIYNTYLSLWRDKTGIES